MMDYAVFDCETTTSHEGNPFDSSNRLCYVGVLGSDNSYTDYDIEYSGTPYGGAIRDIVDSLESVKLVVGFNLKFDLHWIRNYSDLRVSNVWDCQLAAYMLSGQTKIYPSLNECCADAGLGSKLDVVKTEYWDKGIDTPNIPLDVLAEYLRQDVLLTERLFRYQRERFERYDSRLFQLFRVCCADSLWLLEAERNGLLFDTTKSAGLAVEVNSQIATLDEELSRLWPYSFINWGSHDHVSVLLFGGEIYVDGKETYEKTLKSGEVRSYERRCDVPVHFDRLIEPDKRSEASKTAKLQDGELSAINAARIAARKKPLVRTWSTEEGLLRNYKATGKAKETIELLLKRSELRKVVTTYYEGVPDLMKEFGWPDNMLHGSFKQVSTRTGRLSSSSPNLQNFAGMTKPLFYSRFQ